MAERAEAGAPIHFYHATTRAVIRPDHFHVSRRLARLVRQEKFSAAWNDDFMAVMQACAENRNPATSWISPELISAYDLWHKAGESYCLSVFHEGIRVGGIFGVHIGGAVATAESMFSTMPNASSVALTILMAGFQKAGIVMVDLQYANDHTNRFKPILLPHETYVEQFNYLQEHSCPLSANYFSSETAASFVQSLSQTS